MRMELHKDYLQVGHHKRTTGLRCRILYSTKLVPNVVYVEICSGGDVKAMLERIFWILGRGFAGVHCECEAKRGRPTCSALILPSSGRCSTCTLRYLFSDARPIWRTGAVWQEFLDMLLNTGCDLNLDFRYAALGPDAHLLEEQCLEVKAKNVVGIESVKAAKRAGEVSVSLRLQRYCKHADKPDMEVVGFAGDHRRREEAASSSDAKPSFEAVSFARATCKKAVDLETELRGLSELSYRLRIYGFCGCLPVTEPISPRWLCISTTGMCIKCSLDHFLST